LSRGAFGGIGIGDAQSVGATWFSRCTMPGRWRSTPMQVSVSRRWVTAAAYKGFTAQLSLSGRENAGSVM